MFRDLIERIRKTAKLNLEYANREYVQYSFFTVGKIEGYIDVLQSMGHKAGIVPDIDDNGCERIRYIEIDGVILVRKNAIDYDGYSALLEK